MSEWLTVVGLDEDGLDGLSSQARACILEARLIVGGEHHLAMIGDTQAQCLSWKSPLLDTIETLANNFSNP